MRRQLCFLPPCGASAQRMGDGLLRAGIAPRQTQFAAMRRADISDLRTAHPLQTSDLMGMAKPSLRLQHNQAAFDAIYPPARFPCSTWRTLWNFNSTCSVA